MCTYSQLQAYVRETKAQTPRGVNVDLCCPDAMSFLHHLGIDQHLSRTLSAPPPPASSSVPYALLCPASLQDKMLNLNYSYGFRRDS